MVATAGVSLDDRDLRRQARLTVLHCTRRLPSATVGECYQALLSDQPGLHLLNGTELPSGLCLDVERWELCGIPAHAGRYPIEIEELPGRQRWRFELEVTEAATPVIARLRPPTLQVGSALDVPVLLESPRDGVIWAVGDGRLPPGLWLEAGSGRLHGIPTTPGVWCCSLRAQVGARVALAPLVVVVGVVTSRARPGPMPSLLEQVRARHVQAAARSLQCKFPA